MIGQWKKFKKPKPAKPPVKPRTLIIAFRDADKEVLWSYWGTQDMSRPGDKLELFIDNCTVGKDERGLFMQIPISFKSKDY